MIPVRELRDLVLERRQEVDGSRHIAAASSLARLEDTLFVVADDEMVLGVFPLNASKPGYALQILEGKLPRDHSDRQEQKPDLESVTLLAPFGELSHGALLALGSGSGAKRHRGALIPLLADRRPAEAHVEVDLTSLYEALAAAVGELNIEGAAALETVLRLLQRGDGERARNARVDLDLGEVCAALAHGEPLPPSAILDVVDYDLGRLHGVELSFSDASPLADGRMVFAASAEDPGSETDGAIEGSALGILDVEGRVEMLEPVDLPIKVEGMTARLADDGVETLMVTDADDPKEPSRLWSATLDA
ncbi:MAG: hypothetical protein ABR529_08115 [Actinomycetota bacterium]